MKVTEVKGIFENLNRIENGNFILKFHTQCLKEVNDKLELSKRLIELEFNSNNEMSPTNDFGQKCMMLLDEFDKESILTEKNDNIREMFFIGILIDEISFDIISKTSLLNYYEIK